MRGCLPLKSCYQNLLPIKSNRNTSNQERPRIWNLLLRRRLRSSPSPLSLDVFSPTPLSYTWGSKTWKTGHPTSSPGFPFVMRWKNRDPWPGPVNEIPVLNGFLNTIEWDQSQSDLSDLTLSMRRVTGSPWIADFRSWTWPEVAIPVANQKDRGLWKRDKQTIVLSQLPQLVDLALFSSVPRFNIASFPKQPWLAE